MSDRYPLVKYEGARPPAPSWFRKAVETPSRLHAVTIDGVRLTYQQWGNPRNPGLLLAHGNAAHSNWYDFIAPYFIDNFNVVALTFSGMGDSEWRDAYGTDQFSAEQVGVMQHVGMFDNAEKPIIVGHSLGGLISLNTAARHGHRLKGVASLDTPVLPPEIDFHDRRPNRQSRNTIFPDLKAALGRFRLLPEQNCENLFILDHIARHSVKKIFRNGDTGWIWKLDPKLWQKMGRVNEGVWNVLPSIKCEVAFFRGENSNLLTPDVKEAMSKQRNAPFVSIKNAGHHLFLDNPLDTISELKDLFSKWDKPTL